MIISVTNSIIFIENEFVGEFVSSGNRVMFEGEVFDFLREFKVPPELGMAREAATGFKTCITEGCVVGMAIDEMG